MAQPIRSDRPEENDLPALYYRLVRQMEVPGLILCDPEGRIASWNRGCEKVFGWKEAEVTGQLGRILFTPEDIEQGQFEKENLLAAERGHAADIRWHVKKDGTRVFITGTVVALRDDDGTLLGFSKVMTDTTQVQRAHEELAASILTAQEDERRRIARELHDDLSQRLAVIEIGLTELEKNPPDGPDQLQAEVKRIRSHVGSAAVEARRLSHRLHPSIVDDLGLHVALRGLTEEFQSGRSQKIDFASHNVPETIPTGLALVFYRITQEALRNVAKHAGKDPVTVTLTATENELYLGVEDAGPGFNPEAVRSEGGLGLKSMRERAQLVGGTLSITSAPGDGTTIEVRAPLERR